MSPHHNSLLNIVSVIAFLCVAAALLYDSLHIASLNGLLVFLAVAGGYVLADVVSGFVHFLGDTVGSEKTPLIGKTFIFPFREHHIDQTAITRHNFFVTNGHNCLVSLPVMIALHVWLAPHMQGNAVLEFCFVLGFALVMSVFATNQIHKWAHIKKPHGIIRMLQNMHIILNPKHHAIHHTAPYNRHFSITTGWTNALLALLFPPKKRKRS